ncbi:hypothetical protein BpHYR1_045630 [Brachionus plicatilis]|uniref:Uncharacterized protein n=1 Tax=Brachionus plicatilis TaxID=10195 RepID=A0A3M7QSD4_BRAPC|nr:hypothetical protein BpHYR1_045630 [Brachionus plicatilis]
MLIQFILQTIYSIKFSGIFLDKKYIIYNFLFDLAGNQIKNSNASNSCIISENFAETENSPDFDKAFQKTWSPTSANISSLSSIRF